MDLLNLLIYPNNLKSICFLCLKKHDETISLDLEFTICDEYLTEDITLSSIITYLFPDIEILMDQACTGCTNFLLESFIRLQKHNLMKDILCQIITTLNKEVDCVNQVIYSEKKQYVKLKMAMLNDPSKNGILTSNDKFCNENKNRVFKNENNERHSNDIGFETTCNEDDNITMNDYEVCKKCEMKFLSKILLNKHEMIAHKNIHSSVICEFCGKDCKKKETLKAHLNCHKEKVCPYCTKTLKSHSHFNIHVKNHEVSVKRKSRKSEYFCSICPFKSVNKKSLEAHVNKVHLQIRPYVCQICDKGFYKKSNLTEHIGIHTKVKNLTCEECGENFVTKKTLREHLRLHSGEKPYQCEICDLKFVTSGRKSDHYKRKHMEKTVCCFFCDKKFSLKKELNSHMKKIHGQINRGEEMRLVNQSNLFHQSFIDKEELLKL